MADLVVLLGSVCSTAGCGVVGIGCTDSRFGVVGMGLAAVCIVEKVRLICHRGVVWMALEVGCSVVGMSFSKAGCSVAWARVCLSADFSIVLNSFA